MSTERPINPEASDSTADVSESEVSSQKVSSGGDATRSVDEQLIEETKQQIRGLVREIAQLAQSDISVEEFYAGFLGRVVSALAADGGAIWMLQEGNQLDLQYQINLQSTGLIENQDHQTRHGLLIKKVLASGQTVLMAPQSGPADDDEAGNPTDYLLLLGVVKVANEVQGMVEVFQRPGAGPTTQRGYVRFIVEMCEIFGDYLKSRRLKHYSDRQTLWTQLEKFIDSVHRSLDSRETAYTMANEGRRLIQCDRVSVALRKGGRFRIEAVSGMDMIDRRAATVKDLGQLSSAVAASREPVWYMGSSEDLPPQIEESLQSYVDQSHSKMIAVIPLSRTVEEPASQEQESRDEPPVEVVGALIVENIDDNRVDNALRHRVEVVAQHSGVALANAEEHQRLFLLPLWRALGKAAWVMRARTLPKTLAILVGLIATILALVLVPADFHLKGKGVLQPQIRHKIWAPVSGVVSETKAKHGDKVAKDSELAHLRNSDLEVELEGLLGKRLEILEQIDSLERVLVENPRLNSEERNRYQGQLNGLMVSRDSLDKQIKLYQQKQEKLIVKSPIDGEVITWHVRERLIHRPVQPGDELMTVVDPSGPWEVEIHMRESRMGYVARSWQEANEQNKDMQVEYILASHPDQKLVGRVSEIHAAADIRGDEGNTVLIRVEVIDKEALPDLRHGVDVTAKVDCGRQPIGYVWLYELINWVQKNVLFWL